LTDFTLGMDMSVTAQNEWRGVGRASSCNAFANAIFSGFFYIIFRIPMKRECIGNKAHVYFALPSPSYNDRGRAENAWSGK